MKTLSLIFVVLATASLAQGQPRDSTTQSLPYKKSYWFDIGAGWGGQGGAFNVGVSYEMVKGRFLSVRYSSVLTHRRCDEYLLFIPVGDHPIGRDADSYELFFGVLQKEKFGIVSYSAGLSVVKIGTGTGNGPPTGTTGLYVNNCPVDYTFKEENNLGLSLRAQFFLTLRWFGFGVSPYVNITPKYTYASITFNLAFGRFKPRVRK